MEKLTSKNFRRKRIHIILSKGKETRNDEIKRIRDLISTEKVGNKQHAIERNKNN